MGQGNHPLSYYIERRPPIRAFIQWAAPPPPGTHEPIAEWDWTYWSLLSMLGSAGSGKSVTLRHLHTVLSQLPPARRPFVFPILDLKDVVNEVALHTWLGQAAAAVPTFAAPAPAGVVHVDGLGNDAERLCNECGFDCQALLVDGFEEAPIGWRMAIEEFLARILRANTVRVLLPRRDDMALENSYLRNKEVGTDLEPLPQQSPAEQIRQRLTLAGQVPTWSAWDTQLDQLIVAAHLNAPQQAALLTALAPDLTPNPYINLLLLQRKLAHLANDLGAADYRWCLDRYMERAGEPNRAEFVIGLKRQPSYQPFDGQFTESIYTGRLSEPDMDSLVKASVVKNLGKDGYKLEAGVVELIRHLP